MRIVNLKIKTLFTKNNLILTGCIYVRGKNKRINKNNLKLELNEKKYDVKFILRSNLYIIKIPLDDLMNGNIHNKAFFSYKRDNGTIKKWSLRYSILGRKRRYLNSKIKIIEDKNTSVYVRQSANNRLIITVREINKTDYFKEQAKINLAYVLSKFIPKTKIIMYEKHSEKYEESASIVYENLIDQGYKNIYYIINEGNRVLEKLDDKYKKNIIYKYTFKHYLLFFSAKAFIATESPGHAIELRVANKHAARRIYNDKFKYVFLQHGVMYMVSLDSKGRSFFRKDGGMPVNSKIVVSSELEAKHFTDLAGFNIEDLYITGLPKYDKNEWNKKADKIVIMLTWRPWEYNILRNDINDSPYYNTLKKIINAVPDSLREKVILMPHPLTLESLQNSELSKYILEDFIYDNVLKDTKILITDYSSIAYDAFYRGSNIIFYWEEKDFCMEQYGGHLMLNEDNVFGEVCYTEKNLDEILEKEYKSEQKQEYMAKYEKIVQFHDNNNTKRLINLLKRDKII